MFTINTQRPRRALIATATTLIAATTLVACNTNDDNNDAAAGNSGDTITITHALGEAEITGTPQRIVALGQGSAETAIALGVIPVGVESYEWGADDSGQLPWIREAVVEQGGEMPELITGGEDVSAEEIAKLKPDLVLAPWSGITQEQYDQISAVAPTIAYPEAPWTIDWEDQTKTIAKALGKEDEGQKLIDGIEEDFQEVRDENPEFADYDFAFIYNQGPSQDLGVFMPSEQRANMVSNIGLTVAPVVDDLKDQEVVGTDSAQISLENADQLNDVDIIFTFYSDEANREEMHNNPAYGSITAIKDGAEVAPTDQSFVTASSMINALTVPWSLERYVPMIKDAISKADNNQQ